MSPSEIKVHHVYRGKRYREGMFGGNNDRHVIYIDPFRVMLQYDSDTVQIGRHYPRTTVEAFARWAKCEVPVERAQAAQS
jgi:hypothetical protein